MKHLSTLSCVLAVLSCVLAVLAFLAIAERAPHLPETVLGPCLAVSAVTAGCVATSVRRKTVSRANMALSIAGAARANLLLASRFARWANTAVSIAGAALGGIVLLWWAVLMLGEWFLGQVMPM